jgi:hypothetical protein
MGGAVAVVALTGERDPNPRCQRFHPDRAGGLGAPDDGSLAAAGAVGRGPTDAGADAHGPRAQAKTIGQHRDAAGAGEGPAGDPRHPDRHDLRPCRSDGCRTRLWCSARYAYVCNVRRKRRNCPRAPIRRFVDGLPAEPMRRRKLAWYENGYHMLLRDLQAPVVIADVASWVLTPAAPLPSGADRTAAEAFLTADGRLSLAGR